MKTMRAAASYYIYPRARGHKVACPKLTGRACYESAFADVSGGTVVKNSPANAGDMGSVPDQGRSHMPRNN